MKVIREELGEDNTADEAEEFRRKARELTASQEVKDRILKEIGRFKITSTNAAESSILRGYIETLLSLPWDKCSEDSEDLKAAWKILEEGHYGLKDVKERIMEFLSVRKLTHKGKSPFFVWWDLLEPVRLLLQNLLQKPLASVMCVSVWAE